MTSPWLPVVPALRWSEADGYGLDQPSVRDWLRDGVEGFILFGGTAEAARAATDRLQEEAGRPLLFGADLERGAGQQFRGATPLPPLAALAAAEDPDRMFEAGALTGREARALGVSWVFAPVADLAVEPRNPIVGTRSPGADPRRVADAVSAWIEGCRSAGAIPCVKHFPGHGRTVQDSHETLPTVHVDRATLASSDLVPFQAAIRSGVPSVMTAHVAYPALDPSGRPATRSRPILHDLLRGSLGFDGVVVTDALIMGGVGEAATSVVEALQAGVDLLLYPPAELPVAEILAAAEEDGRLDPEERARSRERIRRFREGLDRGSAGASAWGSEADRRSALDWAAESLGDASWSLPRPDAVALTVVDDDVDGPYSAPSREPFRTALEAQGVRVPDADRRADAGGAGAETATPLLCVYGEPRAWKGRAGLSDESRARVVRWLGEHPERGGIVVFGGPVLKGELPARHPTLLAWGGEALMQEAAARRIAR